MTTHNPYDGQPANCKSKEVMTNETRRSAEQQPIYPISVAPPPASEAGGDSTVSTPDCKVSGVELPEPPPATHRHRSLGDLWSRLDLQRHAIAYADARVAEALLKKSREHFVALHETIRMHQEAESQRDAERLRAAAAERERDALRKDAERLDWMAHHSASLRHDDRSADQGWYLVAPYHCGISCVDGRRRFQTSRAAIDAAIAAERGDKE